jgi:proteasome lid subunit RPN8/RPN11
MSFKQLIHGIFQELTNGLRFIETFGSKKETAKKLSAILQSYFEDHPEEDVLIEQESGLGCAVKQVSEYTLSNNGIKNDVGLKKKAFVICITSRSNPPVSVTSNSKPVQSSQSNVTFDNSNLPSASTVALDVFRSAQDYTHSKKSPVYCRKGNYVRGKQLASDISVTLTRRAVDKMRFLVSRSETEISWFFAVKGNGSKEGYNTRSPVILDLFLYPQKVTSSTCRGTFEISANARENKRLYSLCWEANPDCYHSMTPPMLTHPFGHSHVNMDVMPSDVDITELTKCKINSANWSIIVNKRGDINVMRYEKDDPDQGYFCFIPCYIDESITWDWKIAPLEDTIKNWVTGWRATFGTEELVKVVLNQQAHNANSVVPGNVTGSQNARNVTERSREASTVDVQTGVTFPHGLDAPLWVFTEPVVQVSVEEYKQNREKYPDTENYHWKLLRNMYGSKAYRRDTRPEREGLFNLYAEREAPVGHYIELEGKFYKVVETPTASQFNRNDIRHVVKKHRQYYVVLPDGKSVYRGSYHLNEACIRVVAEIEMEINP